MFDGLLNAPLNAIVSNPIKELEQKLFTAETFTA